jgi:steroid 5-alpha reductase family enzyme
MAAILTILALNFALLLILFLVLWMANLVLRDPSFIDSWWPIGMVVVAWTTLLQVGGASVHGALLVTLCTLWGLRLGVFLFWRWRRHGPERRYQRMLENAKEKRGWGFSLATLLVVFLPQLPLQFIVALPAQLGQLALPRDPGFLALFGAALALFGIIYEATADAQLAHFKSDPANKDRVMDRGLWRTSRHPNYFGELCTWWGIYLIAVETGLGAWSLPGPLVLTFLLTRVSGAPTTEPHLSETRPDYDDYKRRTSPLIPWPPSKRQAAPAEQPHA